MRILHVVGSLDPTVGGPAAATFELCRELVRKGEQVSIYTTNALFAGNGRIGRSGAVTDIPLTVDGVEITYFSFGGPRQYPWSIPMWRAMRERVATFDLVHIHSLYLFHSAAASYFCRRYQVPFVIRPHGTLDPFLRGRHRLRKWIYESLIERRTLAAAAAIQFTAAEELELARRSIALDRLTDSRAWTVIPNGVVIPQTAGPGADRLHLLKFLKKYPQLRNRRVVLFLGRINFKKGLDILIDAFAQVCRICDDVHLLIAGPDNESYGRLVRQWLAEHRITDRATFSNLLTGAEKRAAFESAAIFALPSYTENFAIAAVEAMAYGVPVIISNRVNIWREVEAAGAGIVANCDASEFAAAIASLLNNEDARIRLGQRGRQLALRFSWKNVAGQMLELYRIIASRRNHAPAREACTPISHNR
jgi:glycosyltransferase involved in cell wall biosynthesis